MDNISMILSGLLLTTFLILLGPSVLRMNKGRVLQNIALWVAIFCVIGIAYRTVGPGKDLSPAMDQVQIEKNEEAVLPSGSTDLFIPRTK